MIDFLIDLLITQTLFNLIWSQILILPLKLIFYFLKLKNIGLRILKGLGVAFFSLLSSFVVFFHNEEVSESVLILAVISGFLMLFNLVSAHTYSHLKAKHKFNEYSEDYLNIRKELNFDIYFWIIALAVYILSYTFMEALYDDITNYFLAIKEFINEINIIKWSIILYTFYAFIKSLLMSRQSYYRFILLFNKLFK
ncbi:hypothetical protein VOI54_06840 [Tamlana sp. 2201CG12-4]|uniref:hypothetical protein n=1 Tax=Tamlana sp. 2201CG12-4 TaxID=3112582 RepID=UPI002DBBC2AC|nr:hypothetical protein [Tamlana sp. 2201CG12-4]MEC3906728.1 hypothetical protein [Tamlana sp. 2201CG12-4]